MTIALLAALLLQAPQDGRTIPALIEEAGSPDPAVRRRAIEGLAAAGAGAVPAMIAALGDEHPGLDERVDELVGRLGSPEWSVRSEAQAALVAIGRRARARLLQHSEAAKSLEAAWRIKSALAEIAEGERDETARDYRAKTALCEAAGLAGDARAGAVLMRLAESGPAATALADAHQELRVRAIEALGLLAAGLTTEQADGAAVRAIATAGETRERRQLAALVTALGRLRKRAAVPALTAMLRDADRPDAYVRRLAMRALAAIDDPQGVAAVVAALEAPDPYLREAAADVLAEAAGRDLGIDPRVAPEAAREAIRAARAWWEKKYGQAWAGE